MVKKTETEFLLFYHMRMPGEMKKDALTLLEKIKWLMFKILDFLNYKLDTIKNNISVCPLSSFWVFLFCFLQEKKIFGSFKEIFQNFQGSFFDEEKQWKYLTVEKFEALRIYSEETQV